MVTLRRALVPLWSITMVLVMLLSGCSLFPTRQTQSVAPTALPTESQVVPVYPVQEIDLYPAPGTAADVVQETPRIPEDQASIMPRFASYVEPPLNLEVFPPVDRAEPDLSNVQVPFALSQAQLEHLADRGFVVSPGDYKEFFMLYEQARYDNDPIFVTSDSLLHIYHLLFDKVLRTAEVTHFTGLLRDLNIALLQETDRQYQALKGSEWEDAARKSVAFVGVASRLLDPQSEVPAYALDLVEAELEQIEAASGILPSPLFPGYENGEDYTQYIPRGHYTRSEELQNYFKSMMWYGRMTFRLVGRDPAAGRAETRSAILLVNALNNAQVNGEPAMESWLDLYSPTAFFVGRSDDLTALQYDQVLADVYGESPSPLDLANEEKLTQFIDQANQLPAPRILGLVIQDTDDETQVTKGLRFMGQRFVPDAYIFRQLIYRNVGTQENRRGLPKGLDLFAAMGSERAYQILDQMGETKYERYPEQMTKMRDWLSSLSVQEWTETLYNTWLYTFFPLIDVPGQEYPAFMQSEAWLDKQLNTVLGSWTELKHDTILYAKQVYAELGGGPPPPPPVPPKGYVEPVPLFFARLKALTEMTLNGLGERELLTPEDEQSLTRLAELAGSLQLIAEKELRGEPLTDVEYELIRYYGGELEHLTMAAADSLDVEDPNAPKFMEEEPQVAVIADVATDPSPTGLEPVVLEEAVGRVNPIYVVVPIVNEDGSTYLQVAKGGVFSQYEFPWPASDRLTNEKWRSMLDDGQAPPLADWMDSFIVQEGEYTALTQAVASFHNLLTSAYWDLGYSDPYFSSPALAPLEGELQSLRDARQYIGHQLVSRWFRSFDLQAQDRAVVTVREMWQDQLFQFSGDYAIYDEQPIAQRGPYTMDATYTLVFQDGYWQVVDVVYADQPPEW